MDRDVFVVADTNYVDFLVVTICTCENIEAARRKTMLQL
jgi:hypothetical protein